MEHNFGIKEGALNFADSRPTNDLSGFYDLTRTPRAFQTISAPKSASFFLHDKRKATAVTSHQTRAQALERNPPGCRFALVSLERHFALLEAALQDGRQAREGPFTDGHA